MRVKITPIDRGILRGEGAFHCKLERHSVVNCAKTAEPIEMPFWVVGLNRPKESGIRWGLDLPTERGSFGERGTHCKVQGLSAFSCAKTAEPIEMPFGMLCRGGHEEPHIRRGTDPHVKGQLLGKDARTYRTTFCHEL